MRRLKILGGLALALTVGWFIFATAHIVYPEQGALKSETYAVVSLSPPHHRLPYAEQLVNSANTDTLVISFVRSDAVTSGVFALEHGTSILDYCEYDVRKNTICFTPAEVSTLGEILSLQELANTHSWESLTIATSQYHVYRTRYLVERCLNDEVTVEVMYADVSLSITDWAWHIVYENAAILKAFLEAGLRC